MFADEFGDKCAHVRFFVHGSELNVLGELAEPHTLFLLSVCKDELLTRIAGKLKVDYIDKTSAVAPPKLTEKNHFFYRKHFEVSSPLSGRMTDAALHEKPTEDSLNRCDCCAQKDRVAKLQATSPIGDVFKHKGVKYFLQGFVYFVPEEGKLAEIGQIVEINTARRQRHFKFLRDQDDNLELVVCRLFRFDEVKRNWAEEVGVSDSRKLCISNTNARISSRDLEGKCNVLHVNDITNLDTFKDQQDNFWLLKKVSLSDDQAEVLGVKAALAYKIRPSAETALEFANFQSSKNKFLASGKKAIALELFGGVGGMALGLDLGEAVETKWMVEDTPTAARTAQANLP